MEKETKYYYEVILQSKKYKDNTYYHNARNLNRVRELIDWAESHDLIIKSIKQKVIRGIIYFN